MRRRAARRLPIATKCGQAGTSSKIENYLGFPGGISGQELAAKAYAQADADRAPAEPEPAH